MTEAPEPQFVWTCQQCGRKLPTRLDICRCGTRRAPGSPEEPVPVAETAKVPAAAGPEGPALPTDSRPGPSGPGGRTEISPGHPGTGILNWMVLLTVAAAVIGALVAIQVV